MYYPFCISPLEVVAGHIAHIQLVLHENAIIVLVVSDLHMPVPFLCSPLIHFAMYSWFCTSLCTYPIITWLELHDIATYWVHRKVLVVWSLLHGSGPMLLYITALLFAYKLGHWLYLSLFRVWHFGSFHLLELGELGLLVHCFELMPLWLLLRYDYDVNTVQFTVLYLCLQFVHSCFWGCLHTVAF